MNTIHPMKHKACLLLILLQTFPGICRDAEAGITVRDLRCERQADPLGVDESHPRLSWKIDAGDPRTRGVIQTAYQVLVASTPQLLARDTGDLWDSGKVLGDESLNTRYDGLPLRSNKSYFWKVRAWTGDGQPTGWSSPASCGMGILEPSDWAGQWIKADLELYDYQKALKKLPDHDREAEGPMWARTNAIRKMTAAIDAAPAVWLRKEFATQVKQLVSARMFISGMGMYELYLNGRKVNDHHLNNAPYDCDKAVPYQVHDVTRFVRQGGNAVGVLLGNGYFNPVVPSALREYAADFIDTPRLRCELVLEYADGSEDRVPSDTTWSFTTDGPIRFNSLRAGESYDARMDLGDWSCHGYRAGSWKNALVAEAPAGVPVYQSLPPVRVVEEIPAVAVTQHGPGYRFDIGVEATGWARLKLHGKAGQKITIQYPGVGTHTLGRYQECQYVCKGDGDETYEPRFAFAGYRYVDVSGLDYQPAPADMVGCEVVSDLQASGRFSCSSPELMRIQDVVRRTIRNYYIQMPMDPVREKVCWTQDVQSNFEPTGYNFDVSRIYAKWQDDYIRSVQPDGYVPTVVPGCFDGPTINGPWWGGMIIYNPWQLHRFYGDRRILERSYEPMKHYLRYLDSIASDDIVEWGLGDWLEMFQGSQGARPTGTTVPFTSTCAYLMYNDILRQTALLVKQPDEAAHFADRCAAIRKAIDRRFYHAAEGCYDKGSQTACILALMLNLPAPSERSRVLAGLQARIAGDHDHVTSGFVGLPFLLAFLSENGMADPAWRIATQPTYPGWFDMIFTRNNSVLKEDWAGKMVQMPSLGVSIGGWFYRCLGGISPDMPGFKSFTIRPDVGHLDWVKCDHECPYGLIRSDWSRADGRLTMRVDVPPNTTATVCVPTQESAGVTESGKPAAAAAGVKFLRMDCQAAVYAVGSGSYRFESRLTGAIGGKTHE